MQNSNTLAAERKEPRSAGGSDFKIEPLPWPAPGVGARAARRRHGHRCVACGAEFLCGGPEETGCCAPVCPACYWIELGAQLRFYHNAADALERKRSTIERDIGPEECRAARLRRRKFQAAQGMIAGLGTLVLHVNPACKIRHTNGRYREP